MWFCNAKMRNPNENGNPNENPQEDPNQIHLSKRYWMQSKSCIIV